MNFVVVNTTLAVLQTSDRFGGVSSEEVGSNNAVFFKLMHQLKEFLVGIQVICRNDNFAITQSRLSAIIIPSNIAQCIQQEISICIGTILVHTTGEGINVLTANARNICFLHCIQSSNILIQGLGYIQAQFIQPSLVDIVSMIQSYVIRCKDPGHRINVTIGQSGNLSNSIILHICIQIGSQGFINVLITLQKQTFFQTILIQFSGGEVHGNHDIRKFSGSHH